MARLRKILNLVDTVSSVNYGIWHAAIATSAALQTKYGIESWLISPAFDASFQANSFPELKTFSPEKTDKNSARAFFAGFNPEECVVASHGCWQYASRWGFSAREMGFTWIYTPHGMLEPWSMEQKAWKKIPYFHLAEKPMASKANLVRAVGKPEWKNLKKHFPAAMHIPNGIYRNSLQPERSEATGLNFLFLARLHHKKNIMPLVKAWSSSSLVQSSGAKLSIAGTDDGEKEKLLTFLQEMPGKGIEFLGPVFGKEKEILLADSHFYILPSLSEGFPTSVVEAAGAGLIPLISDGCNFPEILECKAAIDSGKTESSIKEAIENAIRLPDSEKSAMRSRGRSLIEKEFLWELIAEKQAEIYGRLLNAEEI